VRRQSPPYQPGLTGLRGVAVVAVVAYHLGALPGGFVCVELFVVLSEYLITGPLLADPPTSRGQMLRWLGHRVRRLAPAVAVVVAVVLLALATRSGIALDALATLTWWQNWNLIAQGTDYWASAPSPLPHAWSLSIEEQFHMLWPLVTVGLVSAAQQRSRALRLLGGVALAGSAVSFVWAAHLAIGDQPDLSRIYFGTDTRAGALLLGCAAARVAHRGDAVTAVTAGAGRLLRSPVMAAGTVMVLLAATVTGSPERQTTYTVLLPVVALASLATVFAATDTGPFERPLSWSPLQWLGKRSHTIYLWSWPIQILYEELHPDTSPFLHAVVTVAITLPLATLSLRWVETPLRHQRSWASTVNWRRSAWGVGAIVLLAAGVHAANSAVLSTREQLTVEYSPLPDPSPVPGPDESPSTTCVPLLNPPPPESAGDGSTYDPSTVAPAADPSAADGCGGIVRVLVVGDGTGR